MDDLDFIGYMIIVILALVVGLYVMIILHIQEADSLAVVGQYTVSNYTSDDGNFKLFLLSKEKLNFTILTNENDITDKLLVLRLYGSN